MNSYSQIKKLTVLLLVVPVVFFMACDGPSLPTYNDKDDPFPLDGEPPQLESIVPEAGFPGDEVTITGSGFKPEKEQNLINIGEGVADIHEISDDVIIASVPQNESGEKKVRASVWGSDLWSNELTFEYLADFAELMLDKTGPTGIAVDDLGNLYVSSEDDQAIYQIDGVDSTESVYANIAVTGPMEFGADNQLYVVTDDGLARIPDGGGSSELVVSISGLEDFDWHENGDIYLLQGSVVSRYSNGQLEEGLASVNMGSKMRVFDGQVYVTELFRGRVVRFDIQSAGLGEQEVFANMGTPLHGLDIDASGNVYASAYIRDYVYKIPQDHQEEDVEIEEIPEETQRDFQATSIDDRVVEIYLHNTVMYLVQNVDEAGEIGRIWRIFIGEEAGPKAGRE